MRVDLATAGRLLSEAETIILTSHVRPDGDSVGSCLGLMHVLKQMGKQARVIIDDIIPSNFNILPGAKEIEGIKDNGLYEVDLLVVLDVELKRTGRVTETVQAKSVLNIDHHRTNDEYSEYLYLDFKRSATAEIIYELVEEMGWYFSSDVAMCLYTGIATDTGFFKFSNTTPYTMRLAANLLEITGQRPNYIAESLDKKKYDEVIGQAKGIKNTDLLFDNQAAFIFIDKDLVKEIPSTEGILNTILNIEGIRIAGFVKWLEDNSYRVSMRAKDIDVSLIAQKLGGGGHRRAAGAVINKPFAEVKELLINLIQQEFSSL